MSAMSRHPRSGEAPTASGSRDLENVPVRILEPGDARVTDGGHPVFGLHPRHVVLLEDDLVRLERVDDGAHVFDHEARERMARLAGRRAFVDPELRLPGAGEARVVLFLAPLEEPQAEPPLVEADRLLEARDR